MSNVIESFGHWDQNTKTIKNSKNLETKYEIGSSTKSFTAVAIFQLIEKTNFLTLKTKMKDIFDQSYIDKFQNIKTGVNSLKAVDFKNITIEDLLTHQSGLPDYLNQFQSKEAGYNEISFPFLEFIDEPIVFKFHKFVNKIPEEIWSTLKNQLEVDKNKKVDLDYVIKLIEMFNNDGWQEQKSVIYSNTGYYVLGNIIEKVSQMTYYSYIKKYIFDILNMNNSCFFDKSLKAMFKDKEVGDFPQELYYAAGQIISNSQDMIKWGQALLNQDSKIMTKPSYQSWFKLAAEKKLRPFGAGLINIEDSKGNHYLGHSGQTMGYQSDFVIDLKNKKVFVYSVNDGTISSRQKMGELIKKELNKL